MCLLGIPIFIFDHQIVYGLLVSEHVGCRELL